MRSTGVDSPEQRQITDQLAQQMQVEPDPIVRQAVVRAIAEFRTPMAQQVLEAGLADENEAVRVACCQALGQRAEAASVQSLANALRARRGYRRAAGRGRGPGKDQIARSDASAPSWRWTIATRRCNTLACSR